MPSPHSQIVLFAMVAASAIAQQTPPAPADLIRPTYVLGAGDQIVIRANEMEDISDKPFRIDADGFINLPVLGALKPVDVACRSWKQTWSYGSGSL